MSIESVVFHIVCEGFDGRVVQQFPKGNIVNGPGDFQKFRETVHGGIFYVIMSCRISA